MQTKTTKISTVKLTQAMVDRFKIDGFLLVEDFFSHEELDRFGSEVDKAVRYRTVDDNRSHGDKNTSTSRHLYNVWDFGKTMSR